MTNTAQEERPQLQIDLFEVQMEWEYYQKKQQEKQQQEQEKQTVIIIDI